MHINILFSHYIISDSLQPQGLQYPQASLSFTISGSLLKLMSIESVMPSIHLDLCSPHLLLPSMFPRIRILSNASALHQVAKVFGLQHQSLKWTCQLICILKYIYIYTHIIPIVNYSAISSLLLICFRLKIIYKYLFGLSIWMSIKQ